MRLKQLAAFIAGPALAVLLAGTAALAQGNVPPPYAGMQNPFPWDDPAARAAGKTVYQPNCLGCHGVTGNGVASADFSAADYPQLLEAAPDFYFWILSEGAMDRGMPAFRASLSETQRWQVLAYIHSLGGAVVTPPSGPPPGGALSISAVREAAAGEPLVMSATLLDTASRPISGWSVTFSANETFFATALMTIGDAITDDQGVATFTYVPRRAGPTELFASYGDLRVSTTAIVTETDTEFYLATAGMRMPSAGPPVFIGPSSATESPVGHAPTSALRLPGGLFSWLWLYVLLLVLIYSTYLRVMYQVLRIPAPGRISAESPRLVPRFGLFIITVFVLLVVLMVITGPYSHFHLAPY